MEQHRVNVILTCDRHSLLSAGNISLRRQTRKHERIQPPPGGCHQSSPCHTPWQPLMNQSEALLAGGGRRGGRVRCDGVKRDAFVVCLLSVADRHPGVEEDLLQSRPVRRLQAQTPANQLLALCDRHTKR